MTEATSPSAAVATFLAPILRANPNEWGPDEAQQWADALADALAYAIDWADWPFLADRDSIPLDSENLYVEGARAAYCEVAELEFIHDESEDITNGRDDALVIVASWFGCRVRRIGLLPNGEVLQVLRREGSAYSNKRGGWTVENDLPDSDYDQWIWAQRRALEVAK